MSDKEFVAVLEAKVLSLEGDRDALQEQLANIDARIEVLRELIGEEAIYPALPKKRRGRPKGVKNKVIPAKKNLPPPDPVSFLEDAASMGGTDPEVAKRLSTREFKPTAREPGGYGPGVHPGVGGPTEE